MHDNVRRLMIDRMLSEKEVVSFEELRNVLQVSAPTLKRDIRYMREELNAPIRYSRSKGGYMYDVVKRHGSLAAKSMFAVRHKEWYSAQELYVLVKTIDLLGLLGMDESSAIYKQIEPLRSRVGSLLCLNGTSPKELLSRVKVIDHSILHAEPQAFLTLGVALCEHKRVHIAYYNRTRKSDSFREISPLRLVHYRNHWYLDAYCHATNAMRTFMVENVRRVVLLPRPAKRLAIKEVEAALDSSYGMFSSGELKTAILRFDEEAAPFMRREVWHPKQKLVAAANNGVRLSVPYTNSTELIGTILRWGNHVEVESPEELRREVRECLKKTLSLYAE